jgi:preprotein translocase subunit SecD
VSTDDVGQRVVAFTLKPEGADLFATYTGANLGSYFADGGLSAVHPKCNHRW